MNQNELPDFKIPEGTDFRNVSQSNVPEPVPLKQSLPSVRKFRPDMLPEPFASWVWDEAYRMGCQPDYLGAAIVTLMGSLIGARCGIMPKQKDDSWIVYPNNYGVIIGDPGQMKSPSVSAVLQLLKPLEKKASQEYQEAMVMFESQKQVYSLEKNILRKSFSSAKSQQTKEKIGLDLAKLEAKSPKEPRLRRYKTDDITIEKLGELLQHNKAGILVVPDEIVSLLNSFNKSGRESDRPFYLTAWNGDRSFCFDRIGRGTVNIEQLCVSIFGTTQPDKFARYLKTALEGENDGLVQRFQIAVYPDPIKYEYRDEYRNQVVFDNLELHINHLMDDGSLRSFGARKAKNSDNLVMQFDAGAQHVFIEWLSRWEDEIQNDETLNEILKQHLTKYRSLVPSLSMTFYFMEFFEAWEEELTRIPHQFVYMAIRWVEYLKSHAIRIYNGLIQRDDLEKAKAVYSKWYEKCRTQVLAESDLKRKGWISARPSEWKSIIQLLSDHNWIVAFTPVKEESSNTGRPMALRYYLNPKAANFL